MIEYLSLEQVRALHRELVRSFGGAQGIRDRKALESAVARPAMTFDGEDYPLSGENGRFVGQGLAPGTYMKMAA